MESLSTQLEPYIQNPPDNAVFGMWRAVFSLVHVDGEIAAQERAMVDDIMRVFNFSYEQKTMVGNDLKDKGDPVKFFHDIDGALERRQFFRLARIIIWCDGLLHEDELAAIDDVKTSLGDAAIDYEGELRWMNRKPDLPLGETADSAENEMMKNMMYQMIAFYEERGAE